MATEPETLQYLYTFIYLYFLLEEPLEMEREKEKRRQSLCIIPYNLINTAYVALSSAESESQTHLNLLQE